MTKREKYKRPMWRPVEAGTPLFPVGLPDELAERSGVLFEEQVFVPDDLLEEAITLLQQMGLTRG